jgi:hypothetical protein
MGSPFCIFMNPPINFWMLEPILMKFGLYIMASKPISTAYFRSPSHQSVCVSLLSLLGKGSVKCISPFIASNFSINTFPRQQIHATIEDLDACMNGCLCIPLSLLRNNSVKTFLRQRRSVGGVVFYAACVVSKESRWLVLSRTYCFII